MTFFEVLKASSFILLTISGFLIFLSIVNGKKIENKILALDLFSTFLVLVMAFMTLINPLSYLVDGALILSVISFMGTLTFARYLTPRLKRKPK